MARTIIVGGGINGLVLGALLLGDSIAAPGAGGGNVGNNSVIVTYRALTQHEL